MEGERRSWEVGDLEWWEITHLLVSDGCEEGAFVH